MIECMPPGDGFTPSTCGGYGWIICRCGGDLCFCGNFGEIECFGCPDCEFNEDDYPEWEVEKGEGGGNSNAD